jgi:hypothetical protein
MNNSILSDLNQIGTVPSTNGAHVVVGEGNAQVTLTAGHLPHLTRKGNKNHNVFLKRLKKSEASGCF